MSSKRSTERTRSESNIYHKGSKNSNGAKAQSSEAAKVSSANKVNEGTEEGRSNELLKTSDAFSVAFNDPQNIRTALPINQGRERSKSLLKERYLDTQNSFNGVRILETEKRFRDWDKKLSPRLSSKEDSELIVAILPKTDCLRDAHYERYKNQLLNKIFDYSRIIDDPLLLKGLSKEVPLDDLMNQSQQSDSGRLSDEDLAIIQSYKKGVNLLKYGNEKQGKKAIKAAADEGLPHATYVYAIITFKQVSQYHGNTHNPRGNKSLLPTQKEIKRAVTYMLDAKRYFSPLPSFLLGIIQLYDIKHISKIIENISLNSWREYLVDVLRYCKGTSFMQRSQESGVLTSILNSIKYDEDDWDLVEPKYMNILEDKDRGYFKWMVQSVKYELAMQTILKRENNLTLAKTLLEELSSDGFVDAKYLYAFALLTDVFGDVQDFRMENFDEAYTLLDQAISHGHRESMLLLGTLPFRKIFEFIDGESQKCKGYNCCRYVREYVKIYGKDGEFKKEISALVAAEYLKNDSSCITYDEGKNRDILRRNNCPYELQEELESKLKESKERAKDLLPDVLEALGQVRDKVDKSKDIYAQRLSPILKALLYALQGSKLTVQQSPLLPLVIQELHISSAEEQKFLLAPLQQLYEVLEPQVDSQQNCPSKREILSLLRDLQETCTALQMKRCCNISRTPSEAGRSFSPESFSTMRNVQNSSKARYRLLNTSDNMSVENVFEPIESSSLVHDGSVRSKFCTLLDTPNSNGSSTLCDREQKRRVRNSTERVGNSGFLRI